MKTMKAMIVEDEGVAARQLKKMLEAEGLEVIAHCKSNKAIAEYLDNTPEPDVYFMDIHLSDGIVFETLQERELKSPIIFTTAYDEYAIKAFKQNSIDYLLKPIDEEELHQAIEKYKELHQKNHHIDINALSQLLMNQNTASASYRERIRIKVGDRIKSIPMNEVMMVYSDNKITFIRTVEGRSYPIDYTVEVISKELNPKLFYRVNRSHVVCIDYITDVISHSNSRLKIKVQKSDNQEIIVARERVKDFKEWLG